MTSSPGRRNPVDIVRRGYDAAAERYVTERLCSGGDIAMLDEFESRLAAGSRILDLGCGAGRPISARLSARFSVAGIDLSEVQVRMAREAVPNGNFRVADMITADLGDSEFDGVCSFYAIIHVPREHHRAILGKIKRALRPGGIALLCLGAQDIESDIDEICGEEMYWSHFDADTYLAMIPEVGFDLELSRLVRDESYPESAHLFVLVRRP